MLRAFCRDQFAAAGKKLSANLPSEFHVDAGAFANLESYRG